MDGISLLDLRKGAGWLPNPLSSTNEKRRIYYQRYSLLTSPHLMNFSSMYTSLMYFFKISLKSCSGLYPSFLSLKICLSSWAYIESAWSTSNNLTVLRTFFLKTISFHAWQHIKQNHTSTSEMAPKGILKDHSSHNYYLISILLTKFIFLWQLDCKIL